MRIPSKIEWDPTNGARSISCDRAIRYSGLRGLFSGSSWRFLGIIFVPKHGPWLQLNLGHTRAADS